MKYEIIQNKYIILFEIQNKYESIQKIYESIQNSKIQKMLIETNTIIIYHNLRFYYFFLVSLNYFEILK